jgi:hypothetical protein
VTWGGTWVTAYLIGGFATAVIVSVQARLASEEGRDQYLVGNVLIAAGLLLVFWPFIVAHAALYELMKKGKK